MELSRYIWGLVAGILPRDPRLIGGLAAMMSVFLATLAAGGLLTSRAAVARRVRQLERRREALRRQALEPARAGGAAGPRGRYTLFARLAELLRLSRLVAPHQLRGLMAQAGWYDPTATSVFLVAHVLAPLLLAGLAVTLTDGDSFGLHGESRGFAVAAAGALGLGLPGLALKNAIAKRRAALDRQYPEALDLLLVCVEAGLSMEAAFQRVTQELAATHPEITEELRLTSAELAFLNDRQRALRNLARRVRTDSFRSLANALAQSEAWGTSITSTLRTLSQENRKHRELRLRQQGQKLDAKLSIPLILFFMPALLVVLMGPSLIQALG